MHPLKSFKTVLAHCLNSQMQFVYWKESKWDNKYIKPCQKPLFSNCTKKKHFPQIQHQTTAGNKHNTQINPLCRLNSDFFCFFSGMSFFISTTSSPSSDPPLLVTFHLIRKLQEKETNEREERRNQGRGTQMEKQKQ